MSFSSEAISAAKELLTLFGQDVTITCLTGGSNNDPTAPWESFAVAGTAQTATAAFLDENGQYVDGSSTLLSRARVLVAPLAIALDNSGFVTCGSVVWKIDSIGKLQAEGHLVLYDLQVSR
jgi:hypothetical protein